MQIEIISNINMDSLKFYLNGYYVSNSSSFGNYLLDLLDDNSKLYRKEIDCILCFIDIDTFSDDIEILFKGLIKLKKLNKLVILNTLCYYPFYLDTYLNDTFIKEMELNNKILNFAKENQLLIVDFNAIVKRLGSENVFNDKFWYIGKIKYTSKALEEIALNVKNIIKANEKASKKCLVVDLDNTLWKGVISEESIVLSNEGEGSIFQEFQKKIKRLKDFGVLLAINSKNNYEDALRGLRHTSSILNENDFIIIKANWDNKNENLQKIAKELNIAEDSIVFLDDNPIERELVKRTTSIIVPDFPKDIYLLNDWFIKNVVYEYFYKLSITNEDILKQEQYIAKIKRDEISKSMDYNDFLNSLNIKISFQINDKNYIQRYAQLTQKTNQFNLTTKRYTTKDIETFINDENYLVIGIQYEDKYAKEGIIGLSIVKRGEIAYIDTLLLSCRVLKRGVEYKLVNEIINQLKNSKKVIGEYIKSSKNSMAKDLYTNLGFKQLNETEFEKEL